MSRLSAPGGGAPVVQGLRHPQFWDMIQRLRRRMLVNYNQERYWDDGILLMEGSVDDLKETISVISQGLTGANLGQICFGKFERLDTRKDNGDFVSTELYIKATPTNDIIRTLISPELRPMRLTLNVLDDEDLADTLFAELKNIGGLTLPMNFDIRLSDLKIVDQNNKLIA